MSSQDEDKKPTVPKFASFKPKPRTETSELKVPQFSSFKPKDKDRSASAPKSQEKERNPEATRKRSDRSDSHRDHRHHSKRHRTDSAHRHHERSEKSNRSGTLVHQRRVEPPRDNNETSRLYTLDTKGDPLIIRYGGLNRSEVSRYYRDGYGRVLGTIGRLVIHQEGARDQFSIRMPGEASHFSKDKDGLRSKTWRIKSNPQRVRKQENSSQDEADDGFLPLSKPKKRTRDQQASASSGEEDQPSYRSIEGKAKPRQYDDSDLESESDSPMEQAGADQNSPLKWKSIQLSRRVKDHPEDIDAWLELANHQDTLLRAGEDIDHKALDAEVHSFAEIKLHMLESALTNVSDPKDRVRVLVPLMREGIKVWNSKTAANKWSELLKDEDGDFTLWKTHLGFTMSNISTFHYDTIKKMLLDRLSRIIACPGSQESPEDFSEAIYIFLRLTRFMYDSGYKELAVAAWQAFLELNFFRPMQLDGTAIATSLESLGDFWESEVPRIGEADAQGWAKFVQDDGMGDAPEPVQSSRDSINQSRDEYKRWASMESSLADEARLPARTMDEGTEDDPFRVVMFSDIESLLFAIPGTILPAVQQQLVDAFLIFSGFPPTFCASTWTEEARQDQFLFSSSPSAGSWVRSDPPETEDPVEIQRKPPSFSHKPLCVSEAPDVLFSGSDWFSYIPHKSKINEVELQLVMNVTKQLAHAAKLEELAAYHLALCAVRDSSSVKKAAKALLKRYPTNFGLYGAYARAEFVGNNHDVATKVLSSATELASKSSKEDVFGLWRDWSWMELELGHKKLAIRRLCSSTDEFLRTATEGTEVSSTHVLKAQQTFYSSKDFLLSAGNIDRAATLTECLALLSYLTAEGYAEPMSASQGNISAAMDVIHKVSLDYRSRGHEKSQAHERVLQFAARLLYLHATHGPFRRAYLLEQLRQFLAYFPRNTIFLSLFEWADSSLRVIDETRTLLHESVLTLAQDCLSSRLFAIHHEVERGNVNTTKAAFEHAVASDACKSNVALWVNFIRFCSAQKELRPKAKDVLFRALRHCPWSKDVMMEAFLTLNRDMESSELKSVFETMTAKGLRIHVDLDEFLEKRRNERRAGEKS
ncbi:hypothetical protein FZEAL_4343 [Fusarium zealandicum]|uniref:DUF1740-domain-containing protein n=1 Tax=Fusarium zealandicum TaxID=1053134 RepID=A0A8H4XKY5_9HYPO|nr:hypothetical protein FZEAL_4343 [Fusarium zealandicum]